MPDTSKLAERARKLIGRARDAREARRRRRAEELAERQRTCKHEWRPCSAVSPVNGLYPKGLCCFRCKREKWCTPSQDLYINVITEKVLIGHRSDVRPHFAPYEMRLPLEDQLRAIRANTDRTYRRERRASPDDD